MSSKRTRDDEEGSEEDIAALSKEVIHLLQKQAVKKGNEPDGRKRDIKKHEKANAKQKRDFDPESISHQAVQGPDGSAMFDLGPRKKVRVSNFRG